MASRWMNSLAYLSRQYDVLASTPPSTPTAEHADLRLRGRDTTPPARAKRTRSWARDNLLSLASKDGAKRSRSSPALAALSAPSSSKKHQLQVPPPLPLPAPEPSPAEHLARWGLERWRRTWVVRTWIVLWDALAQAYRVLVRRRIVLAAAPPAVRIEHESAAESSDDDVLVTRARPRKASTVPQVQMTDTESELPMLLLSLPAPPRAPGLLPTPLANVLLSYSPPPSVPSTQPGTPPPGSSRRTAFHHLPKTLVLDLDETLIHSTSRPLHAGAGAGGGLLGLGWGRRGKPGGHMVEVVLGGRSTLYHVYKRPFVDYFLRKVRRSSFLPPRPQTNTARAGVGLVHARHLHRLHAGVRGPGDRLARRRPRHPLAPPLPRELHAAALGLVQQGPHRRRGGPRARLPARQQPRELLHQPKCVLPAPPVRPR